MSPSLLMSSKCVLEKVLNTSKQHNEGYHSAEFLPAWTEIDLDSSFATDMTKGV